MKFLGFAAAALMISGSAFAGVIISACPGSSITTGSGTLQSNGFLLSGAGSGTVQCAAFGSLPVGDNFVSEQIVIETDYTGGTQGQTNTIQTLYTSSTAGWTADTLGASGFGGSSTYSSSPVLGVDPNFSGTEVFYDETATGLTQASAVQVGFSSSVTAGTVQGISGQVYELITYSTSAPEPGSLMLLGSGLLAAGLIGRKKLASRK